MLAFKAAEPPNQEPFLDQKFPSGWCSAIIKSVGGELTGVGRIKGHIHQWAAVLQHTKIRRLNKAPTGIVAFITKDAIEFQRMTNRFMDLEEHLVGGEDQIQ